MYISFYINISFLITVCMLLRRRVGRVWDLISRTVGRPMGQMSWEWYLTRIWVCLAGSVGLTNHKRDFRAGAVCQQECRIMNFDCCNQQIRWGTLISFFVCFCLFCLQRKWNIKKFNNVQTKSAFWTALANRPWTSKKQNKLKNALHIFEQLRLRFGLVLMP